MKEQSICAQTERLIKVSSYDKINMPQSLKQSRQFVIIVRSSVHLFQKLVEKHNFKITECFWKKFGDRFTKAPMALKYQV